MSSSRRISALLINNAEQHNPHANRNNPTLRRLQQQLSNNSSTNTTQPPECVPPQKPTKTFHQPTRSELDTEQKRIMGPIDGRRFHYAAKTKNLDGSELEFSCDEPEILTLLLLKLGKANNLTTSDQQCPDHVKRHIVYYNSHCAPRSRYHDFAIDTCGDKATIPPNLFSDADIVCDGEKDNSFEDQMVDSNSDGPSILTPFLVLLAFLAICYITRPPTPNARQAGEDVPLLNNQRNQTSENNGRRSPRPGGGV
ncbi:MAG: hypothetical protein V4501_12905 [Pseudomonadota bacterium]